MATEPEHIAFANRTQRTLQHLLSDPAAHAPWIATLAFYKALHIVEAVFASDTANHSADHGTREAALKKQRKYAHLCQHYFPLARAATVARYLAGHSSFDDYLTPEAVVAQLLKHRLKQVELTAQRFLKQPQALNGIDAAFFPPQTKLASNRLRTCAHRAWQGCALPARRTPFLLHPPLPGKVR